MYQNKQRKYKQQKQQYEELQQNQQFYSNTSSKQYQNNSYMQQNSTSNNYVENCKIYQPISLPNLSPEQRKQHEESRKFDPSQFEINLIDLAKKRNLNNNNKSNSEGIFQKQQIQSNNQEPKKYLKLKDHIRMHEHKYSFQNKNRKLINIKEKQKQQQQENNFLQQQQQNSSENNNNSINNNLLMIPQVAAPKKSSFFEQKNFPNQKKISFQEDLEHQNSKLQDYIERKSLNSSNQQQYNNSNNSSMKVKEGKLSPANNIKNGLKLLEQKSILSPKNFSSSNNNSYSSLGKKSILKPKFQTQTNIQENNNYSSSQNLQKSQPLLSANNNKSYKSSFLSTQNTLSMSKQSNRSSNFMSTSIQQSLGQFLQGNKQQQQQQQQIQQQQQQQMQEQNNINNQQDENNHNNIQFQDLQSLQQFQYQQQQQLMQQQQQQLQYFLQQNKQQYQKNNNYPYYQNMSKSHMVNPMQNSMDLNKQILSKKHKSVSIPQQYLHSMYQQQYNNQIQQQNNQQMQMQQQEELNLSGFSNSSLAQFDQNRNKSSVFEADNLTPINRNNSNNSPREAMFFNQNFFGQSQQQNQNLPPIQEAIQEEPKKLQLQEQEQQQQQRQNCQQKFQQLNTQGSNNQTQSQSQSQSLSKTNPIIEFISQNKSASYLLDIEQDNKLPSDTSSRSSYNSSLSGEDHIVDLSLYQSRKYTQETKKIQKQINEIGYKKINNYTIFREIGRGKQGKVKIAQSDQGKIVAIKIIKLKQPKSVLNNIDSSNISYEQGDQLHNELNVLKQLSHPNIVKLIEIIDDPKVNRVYMVLEYMDQGAIQSGSYFKYQKKLYEKKLMMSSSIMTSSNLTPRKYKFDNEIKDKRIPPEKAQKYYKDLALALDYMHNYIGIVHRDIKPANLLIDKHDVLQVADFGVSQFVVEKQEKNIKNQIAGSWAFFAPECWDKNQPRKFAIDIWAAGITLYKLIFGDMPFWAKDKFELKDQIINKELEFPPNDFDPNLIDFIKRCLDKNQVTRIKASEWLVHPWINPNPVKVFKNTYNKDIDGLHYNEEEIQRKKVFRMCFVASGLLIRKLAHIRNKRRKSLRSQYSFQ